MLDLSQLGEDDLNHSLLLLFVQLVGWSINRGLSGRRHLLLHVLFVLVLVDDVELNVLRNSSLPELRVLPYGLVLNHQEKVPLGSSILN